MVQASIKVATIPSLVPMFSFLEVGWDSSELIRYVNISLWTLGEPGRAPVVLAENIQNRQTFSVEILAPLFSPEVNYYINITSSDVVADPDSGVSGVFQVEGDASDTLLYVSLGASILAVVVMTFGAAVLWMQRDLRRRNLRAANASNNIELAPLPHHSPLPPLNPELAAVVAAANQAIAGELTTAPEGGSSSSSPLRATQPSNQEASGPSRRGSASLAQPARAYRGFSRLDSQE
ncbi:MAG: hypothetical protein M1829_003994 [Trizodia sp. TS-e1964]|nr:MAG: hypothetical protein M1829_003994 [Trizodia sp. TS-e1964]